MVAKVEQGGEVRSKACQTPSEEKTSVEVDGEQFGNGADVEDGGDKDGEIEECTDDEENGNDPAHEHEEECENEADDDNEEDEDDNKKKEIVFDNDEVIKKAFQGDEHETHTFSSRA